MNVKIDEILFLQLVQYHIANDKSKELSDEIRQALSAKYAAYQRHNAYTAKINATQSDIST